MLIAKDLHMLRFEQIVAAQQVDQKVCHFQGILLFPKKGAISLKRKPQKAQEL